MGNLVSRPFGIPPASEVGQAAHSGDELRQLMRESHREGLIAEDERRLSETALVFGDLRAREAMRPRGEIDYVTTGDDRRTVVQKAIATGRTRLPLVDPQRGIDEAIGVVNAKDLLAVALSDDRPSLRELARPLPRVPEGVRLDELLRDMRRERRHLALVVDEHGTVAGLITLEDVIEELVGEIDEVVRRDEVSVHEVSVAGGDAGVPRPPREERAGARGEGARGEGARGEGARGASGQRARGDGDARGEGDGDGDYRGEGDDCGDGDDRGADGA